MLEAAERQVRDQVTAVSDEGWAAFGHVGSAERLTEPRAKSLTLPRRQTADGAVNQFYSVRQIDT